MNYLKESNSSNKVFVVHRLDRDTSGVLLFAKSEYIKHLFQDKWSDIVKIRGYIAIVEGKVEKDSDTIESLLIESKTKQIYSSNDDEGKRSITHYRKITSNHKYSLLDIKIDTGRKNQIRVHMKDINHPIVGDKKYGSVDNILKRLGLHASVLEIIHPVTGKTMRFETQIPTEFKKIFKKFN